LEAIVASADGAIKDKSKIVDEKTRKKFEKDNNMVMGHLLNYILKPLFDLFVTFKSAKIICKKLEVKYEVNDARKKKYTVREWLCF